MGQASATTANKTPSKALGWGCLAVVFVLFCLLVLDPKAFGAGVGVVVLIGLVLGISEDLAAERHC